MTSLLQSWEKMYIILIMKKWSIISFGIPNILNVEVAL